MRPDARDRLLAETYGRYVRATGEERERLGLILDGLVRHG